MLLEFFVFIVPFRIDFSSSSFFDFRLPQSSMWMQATRVCSAVYQLLRIPSDWGYYLVHLFFKLGSFVIHRMLWLLLYDSMWTYCTIAHLSNRLFYRLLFIQLFPTVPINNIENIPNFPHIIIQFVGIPRKTTPKCDAFWIYAGGLKGKMHLITRSNENLPSLTEYKGTMWNGQKHFRLII
jgi:hypothetical protein